MSLRHSELSVASDRKKWDRENSDRYSSEPDISFTKDMIRFLVFSFLVVVIDPSGTSGKPVHGDFRSILQVDFSGTAYCSLKWSIEGGSGLCQLQGKSPGNGCKCTLLGKDAADPFNDAQTKRSSYPSAPDPEAPNPSDPSSMCHLTQESESESQITCRLHFTRNKFNFNPFGLRFGKRQGGIWAGERKQASRRSSRILQALLKLKLDRMMGQCAEMSREDC